MRIELLWFEECPCHRDAETLVRGVLDELNIEAEIERIEVPDEATGDAVMFPGSPTVRVEGVDVEPDWEPCEECTPRCRIYATNEGLGCLPKREWIVSAIETAAAAAG